MGLVAWFLVALPFAVGFGRRLVRREDQHPLVDDPRVDPFPGPIREHDDDVRNGG